MAPAALLVLSAACALVSTTHASRDEEAGAKSAVRVSVGPASFARVSASSGSGAVNEAHPAEEPSHQATVSSHAREQPSAGADDASSEERAAAARWKAAAQGTMRHVARAAAGLSVIGDDSRALRKAVAELGLDLGLEEGELEAAKLQEASKRKLEARAKLQEYAHEHHQAYRRADALEQEMKATYARLADSQAQSASKLEAAAAVHNDHESEDVQFAQLEKDTEHVMGMFDKIKSLRALGKQMQGRKDGIMKEALAAGFSADEIEREMRLAREQAKAVAVTAPAGAADVASGGGEAGQKEHNRVEAEHKEQLKDLMASSAIEMAQIETAATDVIEGLDAFTAWKQKQDDSPASLAEAASVKAKLSKAVKFLEEHEHLVEQRSREINSLMAKNHMGSLGKPA